MHEGGNLSRSDGTVRKEEGRAWTAVAFLDKEKPNSQHLGGRKAFISERQVTGFQRGNRQGEYLR